MHPNGARAAAGDRPNPDQEIGLRASRSGSSPRPPLLWWIFYTLTSLQMAGLMISGDWI